MQKNLCVSKKCYTFAPAFEREHFGTLAQVVEQWTENPCVLGSTPRGTTQKSPRKGDFFVARKMG